MLHQCSSIASLGGQIFAQVLLAGDFLFQRFYASVVERHASSATILICKQFGERETEGPPHFTFCGTSGTFGLVA